MIFRVELDRTGKKRDAFPPLSELELTFGLVEASPTRLAELFVKPYSDPLRLELLISGNPCKTPGSNREKRKADGHYISYSIS